MYACTYTYMHVCTHTHAHMHTIFTQWYYYKCSVQCYPPTHLQTAGFILLSNALLPLPCHSPPLPSPPLPLPSPPLPCHSSSCHPIDNCKLNRLLYYCTFFSMATRTWPPSSFPARTWMHWSSRSSSSCCGLVRTALTTSTCSSLFSCS